MHIYAITNVANGKIYVGQHSKDDLPAYLAYNIRAADAFVIRSLVCPIDKEQMDKLEMFFIRTLETQDDSVGYNITAGGGGRLGIKRLHTQEEKDHMSQVMMGREITWADKISASQKNRPLTPGHVAALKLGQKGCKKPPRSPEHCEKIRENKKKWWAERKGGTCLNQKT